MAGVIMAGSEAPEFTLRNQDGEKVSLADFAGKRLMLVFYPLDFSPVCTDQLSVYQEVLPDIQAKGADLVGISVDSTYCHRAFREQLNLTMPLLADFKPKGDVSRAYGAWIEPADMSSRSLVLVEDGEVKWSYETETPAEIPGANLIFDALSA